ncbi:MAG TPA: hypothetical protein VGC62_18530 [Pseudomonas sp.]|uniref:hypothetical protein n=1 Tax=Pseudomonas sp. TaxID=306 RepID=UPI002ED81044
MNTQQKPIIIPKQRPRADKPRILDAPNIPVAFQDNDTPGLLPIRYLNDPVEVTLEVWAAAGPGFKYQLVWDGQNEGPEKEISIDDQPGGPLTLEIPVPLLTEGRHQVAYRTVNPVSLVENFSYEFDVVIDKTAPGSPALGVVEFPYQVADGLTAAELDEMGGTLIASIPGYTGMAKHDAIYINWGGSPVPVVHVNETDMGLEEVKVSFDREFLVGIGDGEKQIHYKVYDRAGNVSIDSNHLTVLLSLKEIPTDFPAPIIDPAVGTLVDFTEAQLGVQIDIPAYTDPAAGDQIRMFWGEDNPMAPVRLPEGNEDDDIVLSLRVPFETINQTPVGTVTISYEVTRDGKIIGRSLGSSIDVFLTLPITQPVHELIVQGTSVENPNIEDNFIDEDDYELNGRGIIKWNNDFQVSDNLNLYWGSQVKQQWYQIKFGDIQAQKDILIPIDNNIIKAQGTGAEVPVTFTVTRDGNPNTSKSPIQLVTVRSKEDLPGGSDGLDGPVFKLNAVGVIAPILNPDGAEVYVPPYLNIDTGQTLILNFSGFDDNNNLIEAANFTDSRGLDAQDEVNGYTFKVPYVNLRTICTGFAEATLRVEPVAGSNQSPVNSKLTRVPVHMLDSIELSCSIS